MSMLGTMSETKCCKIYKGLNLVTLAELAETCRFHYDIINSLFKLIYKNLIFHDFMKLFIHVYNKTRI